MFCNNCGKEIGDGMQFCTGCGASVSPASQNDSQQNVPNENVASTETVYYATDGSVASKTSNKKPTGGFRTRLVAIVVAVAVVAGSVLFGWLNPWANNQIMKLILNSEDYTAYVIGNSIKKISKNMTDEKIQMLASSAAVSSFAYMMPSMDGGSGYSDDYVSYLALANMLNGSADISAQLNMTDTIKDLIDENMGYDADMITWINNVAISSSYDSSGNKIGAGANIKINNVDITSANVAMDMESGNVYLESPETLSRAAEINVIDPDESGYKEFMEAYDKIMKAVPDAKTTEKILTRYIKCVLKEISDVEEESEKLEVGDISQRCTKLTFDIDDKMIKNMGKAALEEAKGDDELKGIIKDIAKSIDPEEADEVMDSYEEGIKEALDDIKEMETSGETFAEVTLWINANGEITGLDVKPEGSDMKISAHDVKKGRKCATEIAMVQGVNKVTLSGEGTIKGGKRTMDLSVKAMGMNFATIELIDVKDKDLREGLFNGKIKISVNEELKSFAGASIEEEYADLLFGSKLIIESKMESANKGKGSIALEMDNQIVAKIDVESQLGGGKVVIPANAEHYDNIEDLGNEANPDKIIDALKKAGAPSDITDELE